LTTHVLYRGFQSGALIGSVIGLAGYAVRRRKLPKPSSGLLATSVIRSAGVGTVIGTSIIGVMLAGRMHGKEHIEWADRSWRLLESKGQVEVDDWSLAGAAAGVTGVALVGSRNTGMQTVLKTSLGGLGLGSLVGVAGYMVWRHGIKGGKWDEVESGKKVIRR
jgi:drug/metabolite transporter (DMT)-like permease